jgi:hypothetical protein
VSAGFSALSSSAFATTAETTIVEATINQNRDIPISTSLTVKPTLQFPATPQNKVMNRVSSEIGEITAFLGVRNDCEPTWREMEVCL